MPGSDVHTGADGQPKNYVKPCVLLLLAERPCHGYELVDRLRELIPAAGYDRGGLYRVLRSLESEGAVTSTWEASQQGPDRRKYELTAAGWGWLSSWAGTLRRQQVSLGTFLERHDAVARAMDMELGGRRQRQTDRQTAGGASGD